MPRLNCRFAHGPSSSTRFSAFLEDSEIGPFHVETPDGSAEPPRYGKLVILGITHVFSVFLFTRYWFHHPPPPSELFLPLLITTVLHSFWETSESFALVRFLW